MLKTRSVTGTIKERAVGFPDSLRGLKLSKGGYAARGLVICTIMLLKKTDEFKLNVFPERMDSNGMRVQLDGSVQLQAIPFVLPCN